jgi:hypothetical protein
MAFNRTITITGMDEVMKSLAAYSALAKTAAAQAVVREAEAIKKESQDNLVPVDTGVLRDKAYTSEAKIEGDTVSAEVGYYGPYASRIHENIRAGQTGGESPSGRKYRHWATTGGYKYLERAVMSAESGMLERIADRMRNSIGGKLT